MKILIGEKNSYITVIGPEPTMGRYYSLEDAITGTAGQNRAFHALLNAFYSWMQRTDTWTAEISDSGSCYDFSIPEPDKFRDWFKLKYCAGYSHLEYVDDKNGMQNVKIWEEVPDYAIEDFRAGNQKRIKAVVKSWTKYTNRERRDAIDTIIRFISIFGCDDKKVHEIINGMEEAK